MLELDSSVGLDLCLTSYTFGFSFIVIIFISLLLCLVMLIHQMNLLYAGVALHILHP